MSLLLGHNLDILADYHASIFGNYLLNNQEVKKWSVLDWLNVIVYFIVEALSIIGRKRIHLFYGRLVLDLLFSVNI
jgi:hypothetical protein